MKIIKQLLFNLLPQSRFLRAMHCCFYTMFDFGILKKNRSYKYHYMVKKMIEPSDVVVDIGANLGYFTRTFARLTPKGKVVAIEPIPPFFEVLTHFLKRYPHVEIVNCALGKMKGKITMVMPSTEGVLRTGLPHIPKDQAEIKQHRTQEVDMLVGSELLGKLERIDYMKCDVEGYEGVVFEEIRDVVSTRRPIVQIEIGKDNEATMLHYFKSLNYLQYGIADFRVVRETGKQKEEGDFLFVPEEKSETFEARLRQKGCFS